jgi:hypothetical protein
LNYEKIRGLTALRRFFHTPHGSAAFHGGVLRITQKDLYVRTTIAMVPVHHSPIDAPPWQAALP